MNTKTIIAATALASLLLTTGAFAETDTYPTPINHQAPSVQTPLTSGSYVNTQSSEAYPTFSPALGSTTLSQPYLAQNNGSESGVEPPNSMPKNSDVGTSAYADAQIQNRWFARQAQRHYAMLQARATQTH